ncbi:MAG: hypothetical protein FJ012_00455 [Chloroflexi bacterium]|nr:hypothetical protein [Chloroflexota bacterium]
MVRSLFKRNNAPGYKSQKWRWTIKLGKFALGIVGSLAIVLLGIHFLLPSFSRSALSLPLSTKLTVISHDVFVKEGDSGNWERIATEASLKEGNWVKTSSKGRAVITFFEGSSTEIEPDTVVCLEELFSTLKGSSTIRLNQQAGHTWSSVGRLFDPASRFEVTTTAAAAVVRGTLIGIDAEEDGHTTVKVFAGEAGVRGEGHEVTVSAGWQTTVNPGQPPSPPSLIPPPSRQLTVSIGLSAWLQIIDPLGRNTGMIPPGFGVNRIPFSITTIAAEEQTVTINDPVAGKYFIAFYAQDNGSVRVTAKATSQNGFSQQENRELEVKKGWGYYISLELDVDEQGVITSLVSGEVRALEPGFVADKFYGIKYRPYDS